MFSPNKLGANQCFLPMKEEQINVFFQSKRSKLMFSPNQIGANQRFLPIKEEQISASSNQRGANQLVREQISLVESDA